MILIARPSHNWLLVHLKLKTLQCINSIPICVILIHKILKFNDFPLQGADLNDTLCKTIRHLLYRPVKIVKVSRIIFLVLGICLIVGAIFIHYQRSKLNIGDSSKEDSKATITQVSPAYWIMASSSRNYEEKILIPTYFEKRSPQDLEFRIFIKSFVILCLPDFIS